MTDQINKERVFMFYRFILGIVSLMMVQPVSAALDPIGWSLNHAFPATVTAIGSTQYTVTYTFRNQLPLTLVHPIRIDKYASTNEFSYTDHCSGLSLAPQQTCKLTVTLNPVVTGVKTAQIVITGYDNNSVLLPLLVTDATNETGVDISVNALPDLPETMSINEPSTYQFTFTNHGAQDATGVNVKGSLLAGGNFTFSATGTNCTATLPGNGGMCIATGSFTPTSSTPTTQGVIATLTSTQTDPVIGEATTSISTPTGIKGVLTQGLPNLTIVNQSYQVIMTFTNYDSNPVTISTNTFTCPSGCSGTSNLCPTIGNPLNPGTAHSCTITTTFMPPSPGAFTISSTLAAITAATTATVPTSTTAQANSQPSDRTLTFTNECGFPVAIALSGGATTDLSPDCTSDADCTTGSSCNTGTGYCYWNDYAPSTGPILPAGQTKTLTLPAPVGVSGVMWSGVISGSTGCSTTTNTCLQAECGNNGGTTNCANGQGFTPPATQAEFTFLTNGDDSYDVEVINGFHIPIEVYPSTVGVNVGLYHCTHDGAPTLTDDFGACNWDSATPPSPTSQYYWVTTGNTAPCTPGSCGTQLCGLDINLDQVCGDFSGYWTADELCGANATKANTYFGCTTALPQTTEADDSIFPTGYTYTQLYQCKTPVSTNPLLNSCYPTQQVPLNDTCCGCVNWQDPPYSIQLPALTVTCGGTGHPPKANSLWTAPSTEPATQPSVLPTLAWMKQACPTYYTYPYDDASSDFACNNGNPNSIGYTIVFCAGGSGLPASPIGLVDARLQQP